MIKRLIAVFTTLLALAIMMEVSGARAEEGHHTIGGQAGQVLLNSDVGNTYGNALGYGAFFDYAASDWIEFEVNWIHSQHNSNNLNLNQNDYSVALQYDIDTYDVFTPYIKGGAEFVTHTQDLGSGISYNGTGFGLLLGFGANVLLAKHLSAGLDFSYHDVFTASTTPVGQNSPVNTIEGFFSIMLKLGFVFGGK